MSETTLQNSQSEKENFIMTPTAHWLRSAAVYERVWYLSPEERMNLNKHFLLRTTTRMLWRLSGLEDDKGPTITIGVYLCKIQFIDFCIEAVDEAPPETELLISVRIVEKKNFAVALVQPRYEGMSDEKYYALSELE